MKFNSSNKMRLIVGVVLAFSILILFIIMYRFSKSNRVKNEINPRIHADMKSGFTYDDMMKTRKDVYYNTQKSDYEEETAEEQQRQDSIINAQFNEKIKQIDGMGTVDESQKPSIQQPSIQQRFPSKPRKRRQKVDTVSSSSRKPQNRFFTPTERKEVKNTIKLVIHGEQVVHDNSTIKMRLLEDMPIEDYVIPAGAYIYGIVTLGKERINITVQNVRYKNTILPVTKVIYDRDGMAGLYVPMSIPSEVVKEGVSEGATEMQYNSRQNIVERASSAIVTAGRRIFTKNNRIETVTVKSNYMLYLKDQER